MNGGRIDSGIVGVTVPQEIVPDKLPVNMGTVQVCLLGDDGNIRYRSIRGGAKVVHRPGPLSPASKFDMATIGVGSTSDGIPYQKRSGQFVDVSAEASGRTHIANESS